MVTKASHRGTFFQRNTSVLVSLLIAAFLVIFVLVGLLISARNIQTETLARIDQPMNKDDLPGPKGMISDRSRKQIDTMFQETPHILGGWVIKLQYEKTDNPFIHEWTRIPAVTKFSKAYGELQASGKGFSSAELDRDASLSVRNSKEAKTGLISCGPIAVTMLKITPEISAIGKGLCRATIPPFGEKVNLAIIALVDIDGTQNSPELQEVRHQLLRLQIDVFNREYQGRETWGRQ